MFTIIRLNEDLNVFFIVKKDILNEAGSLFLKLPISVYGFLRVEGNNYANSTVSYKNISDELTIYDLDNLADLAKSRVFS